MCICERNHLIRKKRSKNSPMLMCLVSLSDRHSRLVINIIDQLVFRRLLIFEFRHHFSETKLTCSSKGFQRKEQKAFLYNVQCVSLPICASKLDQIKGDFLTLIFIQFEANFCQKLKLSQINLVK